MLLHNAVDRRQAKAGPLPHRFGRKERLEHMRPNLLAHASAGIPYLYGNQRPAGMLSDAFSLRHRQPFKTLRPDFKPSPFRHRVTRVYHQIHQYLLHHSVVDPNQRQIGCAVEPKLNGLSYQPVQHLTGLKD